MEPKLSSDELKKLIAAARAAHRILKLRLPGAIDPKNGQAVLPMLTKALRKANSL